MKIVIQIIVLGFIVCVFTHYSFAQESNQVSEVPPKLQATVNNVERKKEVQDDESASIKEEIAYLKGRINTIEGGKFGTGDLIKFTGIFVTIFMTLFGIVGVGYVNWVSKRIHESATNKIQNAHEDAIKKAYASMHLWYSYISWYEYKPSYFQGSREDFYLDYGIKRAQKAKDYAEKIQDKQKSDVRKLILECKNHLACFLAARGDTANTKEVNEALNLARELEERRAEFKKPHAWDDTISFVYIRFGNQQEKEKGLKLRDELISREKELGSDFVYAVKAKYGPDE